MKAKNVMLTVLISAAAGAAAGILFAPEKGSRTRRELTKRGRDFSDLARDEFEDFLDQMRNSYNSAREQTDELLEKSEETAKELKKKVKK